MCGIYGITARDPEFINQYIDKCKHRGPDGQGVWHDDTVTLGHNLLSIMADPSVSKQPWRTPKGNILTYNGEIFNYYELKEKYKDFKDTTGCDTELLAWGLDTYGLNFIDEIDSMHGFAYYDINKKEIILSRDHAGIKPVYYAETKEGLVFGSEIKGMLDKVPGCRIMDKLAVSCMSMTGINVTRNTFFSGIKKLLAGETIVYDITNKRIKQTKRVFVYPRSNKTFKADEFRSMVKQTVKQTSIGKRKIGVFLSGGLDSSMIAYELNKLKGPINTFTNRMDPAISLSHFQTTENFNDDANWAYQLAKVEKFEHEEIRVTPQIMADYWDDSIYYMEQPVYNPSLAMYCYTNKVLHDNGIVVTMAGDMGDEILGGYPKYWKLRKRFKSSGKRIKWLHILDNWLDRIKRPLKLHNLLIGRTELREELLKCYPDDIWNPDDPVGSYMALDCTAGVPEEFFMRNDKYGMAYGMEGRFPLASKTFMQYCMDIHSDVKIMHDKSDTKILSKQAYAEKLPKGIINKKKTGWTVPIQFWIDFPELKKLDPRSAEITKKCQGHGKAMIPAMIARDWAKLYQMKEY
jgi:asparagine synthase (glutamine-hydrolysing)